jgi:hypothetical protein
MGSPCGSLRLSPLLRPSLAARSGSEWIEQKPSAVGLAWETSPDFVRALHLFALIGLPLVTVREERVWISPISVSQPPAVHLPFALPCMYQHRLKRRPLPSMLLNIRFCVDSIPSALTNLQVASAGSLDDLPGTPRGRVARVTPHLFRHLRHQPLLEGDSKVWVFIANRRLIARIRCNAETSLSSKPLLIFPGVLKFPHSSL